MSGLTIVLLATIAGAIGAMLSYLFGTKESLFEVEEFKKFQKAMDKKND